MDHDFQAISGNNLEGEEVEEWNRYKNDPDPNFFQNLTIAPDGGFSEVHELYFPARWVSAVILVVFVLYNVMALIELDVKIITEKNVTNLLIDFQGGTTGDTMATLNEDSQRVLNSFFVTETIYKWVVETVSGPGEHASIAPPVLLAWAELLILSYYLASCFLCFGFIAFGRGFARWFRVQSLCLQWLPSLSTYSAMKLLNAIVPVVMMAKMAEHVSNINEARKRPGLRHSLCAWAGLVCWICSTVVSTLVGFDMFLFKLRVVALRVTATRADDEGRILPAVQFLVQLLGVVQLYPFVQRRLFEFIFGGHDSILQHSERKLMETWLALLARHMYKELPRRHFLAVMLSFSDQDFQCLVLNEKAPAKRAARELRMSARGLDPTARFSTGNLEEVKVQ